MKQQIKRYLSLILSIVFAVVVCLAVPEALPILENLAEGVLALGGATLAGAPVSALFLSFLFYGFVGWAYESTICGLANTGHFVNSGFLLGPCCPIYGAGAIACWVLLRDIESTIVLFVAAAIVCSVIEYTVGVLLEKTTHARFWDYSDKPFNINGRVCLYGAVLFGAGCVLVCRVIEPALLYAFSLVSGAVLTLIAVVLLVLLLIDLFTSTVSWRHLSGGLETVRADMAAHASASMAELSDKMLEDVPEQAVEGAQAMQDATHELNARLMALTDAAMDKLREKPQMPSFVAKGTEGLELVAEHLRLSLSKRDLRFFNAFPNLRILPYEGVIRATGLKDRALELFGSKHGKDGEQADAASADK